MYTLTHHTHVPKPFSWSIQPNRCFLWPRLLVMQDSWLHRLKFLWWVTADHCASRDEPNTQAAATASVLRVQYSLVVSVPGVYLCPGCNSHHNRPVCVCLQLVHVWAKGQLSISMHLGGICACHVKQYMYNTLLLDTLTCIIILTSLTTLTCAFAVNKSLHMSKSPFCAL